MTTTPQVLLDRYEVGRLLGAGGMAEVFEGRDRLLVRRVAIKVPLAQYAHDPEFTHRFRREAQTAASLSHPGVVAVYDTGSENGTHFIVMEYVDGRTLKDVIRAEAPLYPDRAAEIAADVCAALGAAHARGLVHRDVKPANIMLMPDGRVKLMDLGIARAAVGETLTQTAAMLGTAQYLSPEQAQGQEVDFRGDLYSLGCCLYEMLTGTVPFRGATPVAIAYRHVREDPDAPPSLEAVCLKAMAKRPENRYQTAAEFRADLERARAGRRTAAGSTAAGAATAAMATTVLPPLGGYPGAADPTAAYGPPVTAGRAARHAAEAPPGRRRWWLYVVVPLGVLALAVLVAFVVSRLVDTPATTAGTTPTLPTATPPKVVETTALPTSTSQLPTTSRLPTTTVPPTTASPTTQPQPAEVQVPDVIGRRPRVARAQLEAAGLRVDQREAPVGDPRQDGRVVFQNPPAGTTVGRGSTVTIVFGVRPGDNGGGGNG